jgi:hypothetical protein
MEEGVRKEWARSEFHNAKYAIGQEGLSLFCPLDLTLAFFRQTKQNEHNQTNAFISTLPPLSLSLLFSLSFFFHFVSGQTATTLRVQPLNKTNIIPPHIAPVHEHKNARMQL